MKYATLKSMPHWPEKYGFYIHGDGPAFVYRVDPHSVSERAGVKVGDCIMELDNRDVSLLSANEIKQVAKNSKRSPPPVSVQSFLKTIVLTKKSTDVFKKKSTLFDLKFQGKHPVQIGKIAETSEAYLVGIRPGDILVEANGKPIKVTKDLEDILKKNNSKSLELKIISLTIDPLYSGIKHVDRNSNQSAEFYEILNCLFDKEPDRRNAILNELNNYNETQDLEKLSLNLIPMLRTTEEREIIDKLKHIIPVEQQELFQTLIKTNIDLSNKRLKLKTMQQNFEKNEHFEVKPGKKEAYSSTSNLASTTKTDLRKLMRKHFGSTPSLKSNSNNDLLILLYKQMDYLLNPIEQNQIKFYFHIYNQDGNINSFVNNIAVILDSSAKRTLWFNLVPLLSEDDQEICKRKLNSQGFVSNHSKSSYQLDDGLELANELFSLDYPLDKSTFAKRRTNRRDLMVCNKNVLNSEMESAYSTFERFVYDYEERRCDEPTVLTIEVLRGSD